MKYLGKLLLSLKEIFFMMFLQYVFLILCILFIGIDKSVIWGSIVLMVTQIIYIIYKRKNIKFYFNVNSYFPYVLLGIGIAAVYNMIIFKIYPPQVGNIEIPIILNILCSGIIGPIFEEILFRYDLIRKLKKFNSNSIVVILLAGIIFGLFHTGITTIIYATIIGLINSYIYVKDKDIIKPIVIHMSGNIFVSFLSNYNLTILLLGGVLVIISYFIITGTD